MKEGYFLGKSGNAIRIHDHQLDLRANHSLLNPLGVSAAKVKAADRKYPSREFFLTAVLKHGVARVRGHGEYSSVEFFDTDIFSGLAIFVGKYLCPQSLLKLVDLKDMSVKWLRAEEIVEIAGGVT